MLALVAGAIVAVAAVRLLLWCAITDREGLDRYTRVLLWDGILLTTVLGGIAAAWWLFAAAAYGLTIVRETSFGADRIADWPHFLALEGLGGWIYVLQRRSAGDVARRARDALVARAGHFTAARRRRGSAAAVSDLFALDAGEQLAGQSAVAASVEKRRDGVAGVGRILPDNLRRRQRGPGPDPTLAPRRCAHVARLARIDGNRRLAAGSAVAHLLPPAGPPGLLLLRELGVSVCPW